MIEILNLYKSFDKKDVIKNVSLRIEDGEFFGLVGINGAGKSTLLRLISSVYYQDKGKILIDKIEAFNDINKRKEIFYLSDDLYYPKYSNIKNFLSFYKTFYDFDDYKFMQIVSQLNLDLNRNIANFSKGMKRQLFIAVALSIKANYILLDEAFDGLDPLARLIFKQEIIKLKEENPRLTVIFTSHNLKELEDLTTTFAIIDNGEIISSGNLDDEKRNICKYQMAFSESKVREDFLEFDVIDFHKEGRVIQLVIKGDEEKIMSELQKMNPLLLEKVDLDFEEFFIAQSKERGYLKW